MIEYEFHAERTTTLRHHYYNVYPNKWLAIWAAIRWVRSDITITPRKKKS